MPFNYPYLLLDPSKRLPSSETDLLLGRVVRDMTDPLYDYTPPNPAALIQTRAIETSYQAAADEIKQHQDNDLRLALTKAIRGQFDNTRGQENVLGNAKITTTSLDNVVDAFNALLADAAVRESLTKLLARSNGKAYMITSVKSVVSADVTTSKSQRKEVGMNVQVPSETFGIPGGSPLALEPSLALNVHKETEWHSSHVIETEQIYAIQYRIIERKGKWRWSKSPLYDVGKTHFSNFGTFRDDDDNVIEEGYEIYLTDFEPQSCDLEEENWIESGESEIETYLYQA